MFAVYFDDLNAERFDDQKEKLREDWDLLVDGRSLELLSAFPPKVISLLIIQYAWRHKEIIHNGHCPVFICTQCLHAIHNSSSVE